MSAISARGSSSISARINVARYLRREGCQRRIECLEPLLPAGKITGTGAGLARQVRENCESDRHLFPPDIAAEVSGNGQQPCAEAAPLRREEREPAESCGEGFLRGILRQTGIAQHEKTQPPDAVLVRLHQHPERLPPSSEDGGNRVSFGIRTFGHACLYNPGRQMVPGFRKKQHFARSRSRIFGIESEQAR